MIALTLRATVITIYKIPTGSMIPTFNVGDVLIANRFYYGLKVPLTDGKDGWRIKIPGLYKKPGVGDIIIFRAPEEHLFYFIETHITSDEERVLLREINEAASFKRPHFIQEGFTNYISINGDLQYGGIIMLHHTVFEKYKEKLYHTLSRYLVVTKRNMYMTYKEHQDRGFWKTAMDTPMAGVSILATVFLNTPLAILPKTLWVYTLDVLAKRDPFDPTDSWGRFPLASNISLCTPMSTWT